MRWRLSASLFAASFVIAALVLPDDVLAQRARGGAPSTGGGSAAARPAGGPPSGGGQPHGGAPTGNHAVPRPPGNYPGYPGHGYGGYYPRYGWGYYPYYGYGAFYGPWWGFGWGYPWYGYGYGYGYYGPYGPYYYVDNTAAVRLQVTPREAEVFVNGSFAGLVDEFDGNFQRLRLPPGQHEIQIYLQGYRSIRQSLMLSAGSTTRIKAALEPLPAGEPQEPRPTPIEPPRAAAPQGDLPERGAPVEGNWPPSRPPSAAVQVASSFGTLAIRVQPAGADILIDGERWQGPDGQQKLFVEVAEGRHRVEIRKDGYQSFVADVEVRRGDVTPLNVSLTARQ